MTEETAAPWRLVQIVDMIKLMVDDKGVVVKHCYREANKVADKLAALSHSYKQNLVFTHFSGMPKQI